MRIAVYTAIRRHLRASCDGNEPIAIVIVVEEVYVVPIWWCFVWVRTVRGSSGSVWSDGCMCVDRCVSVCCCCRNDVNCVMAYV